MCKKIDVLIYFEHVVREQDACFRLRYELEKLGFSVRVASIHFDRYLNILKYKPKLVVLPFFYGTKDIIYFQFKDVYGDVFVVNLHQEQLYNESTKDFFIPKTEITKNVYHIAWSQEFYNDLVNAGIPKYLICLSGNPRTDNYYLNLPAEMQCFKNKEVVFIPTSFSWYFVDSNYFTSNPSIDNNKYYYQREKTQATVIEYFKGIRSFAKKYPNKLFVLRPHPFDPIEKYKELLERIDSNPIEDNIIINREGSIYEWLKVSSIVISWLSTVALEATVFKIPNIIWQPIVLPDWMQVKFIKYYDKIYKIEEDVSFAISHPETVSQNNGLIQYANHCFGRVDGNVNIIIANWICKILKKHSKNQIFNTKFFLKYVWMTLRIDYPKRIFRRFGVLKKNKFYENIIEDLWTVQELDKKYYNFLNRL